MIKRMFLAAAICALAACQPAPAPGNASEPIASAGLGDATVMDEKALYALEAAYNVPAHAYVTADAKGLLNDATKAKVKPLLVKAYDALKLARMAYATGNSANFAEAKANVEDLSKRAAAILAPTPEG